MPWSSVNCAMMGWGLEAGSWGVRGLPALSPRRRSCLDTPAPELQHGCIILICLALNVSVLKFLSTFSIHLVPLLSEAMKRLWRAGVCQVTSLQPLTRCKHMAQPPCTGSGGLREQTCLQAVGTQTQFAPHCRSKNPNSGKFVSISCSKW